MVVCKFFQQGYCRFGQSCKFEHVYGSKYSYRAPQTEYQYTNSGNVNSFGSNASSLFRSAVQNAPSFNSRGDNSIFGHAQPSGSVFDRLGYQSETIFNQTTQAKSIFAQANQSVFQRSQPTNIFQTNNQAKSIFSQATQNVFGQKNSYEPKTTASSIFASAVQKTTPSVTAMEAATVERNIFQIPNKPATNMFGVSNNIENNNDEDGVYSKIEDLSQIDIKAFESADFKLGYVPELPPPKSLCV